VALVQIPQKTRRDTLAKLLFLLPVGSTGHVVHSGEKNVTHNFPCSVGTAMNSTKNAPTRYTELVFLHPMRPAGHVVSSGASDARNGDTLFFMLGWDWYGFEKKNIGTRYVELVFLHPVGSTGRVVHFGASRAQNIDALFFMLLWDREPHHCTERSVLVATVESSLKVRAATNQCGMLHPIAEYSIPPMEHNKPSVMWTSTPTPMIHPPTHNQISSPIPRARARQLNNQVSSFLASYSSHSDNENMCSILLLRNNRSERNGVAVASATLGF
jgi:hypothetical protein